MKLPNDVLQAEEAALALGADVGEEFIHQPYGTRAYSWRQDQFTFWIEPDEDVTSESEEISDATVSSTYAAHIQQVPKSLPECTVKLLR